MMLGTPGTEPLSPRVTRGRPDLSDRARIFLSSVNEDETVESQGIEAWDTGHGFSEERQGVMESPGTMQPGVFGYTTKDPMAQDT
ncbi:MAG: hypothetical protein GY809_14395 [Planctomycetes bacterium]|nr:hypothetical protein [Planctomycetota bacterium]